MKEILMFNILKNYMSFITIYYYYHFIIYHFLKMKIVKIEKIVTNLHDKTEYVIHRRNLKQALSHELIFENVHRVIKFNQKT